MVTLNERINSRVINKGFGVLEDVPKVEITASIRPNVLIELSENGGFVITSSKKGFYTATTIDETMIIAREQIEKLLGLI